MEFFSLQLVLFLVLSALVYLYFNRRNHSSQTNGFKSYPIVGSLPELLRNKHRYLDWMTEVLARCPTNTAIFYRMGISPTVMTANPINVEHVLKSDFDNYVKGDRFIAFLQDLFGRGTFLSNGETWRLHRKALIGTFTARFLKQHSAQNIIVFETEARLVPVLNEVAESGVVIDLQDVFERYAYDNAFMLACSFDPACLGGDSKLMTAFAEAEKIIAGRLSAPFSWVWKIKRLLRIGSERRLRNAIDIVINSVEEIVRPRLDEYKDGRVEYKDLISQFMRNDECKSVEFLRDIVIGAIFAGRGALSSGLTWFFWVLSTRPDVEQNIRREIEEIRMKNGKKHGDAFEFDDLRGMQYLHAAISESMRLYPPVPANTRTCLRDNILPDGTFVPKGWSVSVFAYAMGRMESIWGKDCLEFRTERWLEDGVFRQESAFRSMVFHAGPRICLGKDTVYVQMKSVIATMVERFEICGQGKDYIPKQVLSFSLRMEDGLNVKVRKRDY